MDIRHGSYFRLTTSTPTRQICAATSTQPCNTQDLDCVKLMTEDELARWLFSLHLDRIATVLQSQEFDGPAFLLLTPDVLNSLGFKEGTKLKFLDLLRKLNHPNF